MKLSHSLLWAPLVSLALSHGIKKAASPISSEAPLIFENGALNLDQLNAGLDQCLIVKQLNSHLESSHDHELPIQQLFSKLFPFNAAWNSILATAYISGPPNLILSLIPALIDPSKLTMLVSFAAGGLLGDVFLHLLPQTFLGEPVEDKAHFVLVDERRNVVLGLCIFVGFAFFFSIDKGLRILNMENGHSHSHSHNTDSHSHSHADFDLAESSAIEEKDKSGLKQVKGKTKESKEVKEPTEKTISSSVKTAAWLNLISDFTHNITDGLAITSAFYISKSVGSTTALAVFLHEVPHEIGDFAVLIQGGFTKWQAMNLQFVTAAGAFLGCFLGILIQSFAQNEVIEGGNEYNGLFGTTVTIGDLTLPFTAGGFLYICTVGVIPEVLELGGGNRVNELKRAISQMFFVVLGISLMFAISWFE